MLGNLQQPSMKSGGRRLVSGGFTSDQAFGSMFGTPASGHAHAVYTLPTPSMPPKRTMPPENNEAGGYVHNFLRPSSLTIAHPVFNPRENLRDAKVAEIRARYSTLRRYDYGGVVRLTIHSAHTRCRERRERKSKAARARRLRSEDKHWDDPHDEQLVMVKDPKTGKYRLETRPGLPVEREVSPPRKKRKFLEWDSDDDETLR